MSTHNAFSARDMYRPYENTKGPQHMQLMGGGQIEWPWQYFLTIKQIII